MNFGFTSVAAITVICYLFAEIVKATKLKNKWIPVICGVLGGALGALALRFMPAFPADNWFNAVAVGIVSGFAATGVHQAGRQLGNGN